MTSQISGSILGAVSSALLPERLIVEAAGINGFGSDPAPNVIIASVLDKDRVPVAGLTVAAFTLFNYNQINAHAEAVPLRLVQELSDELPGVGVPGVYKVEPDHEPQITHQVGQTAYALVVSFSREVGGQIVHYAGQTVTSVVMQPRP